MAIPAPRLSAAASQALHESNVAPISKRTAAMRLFQDPEAFGAALFIAAREVLELDELLSFDPHTIRLELQQSLGIKHIDNDIFDRLMAIIAVVDTDMFYTDWGAFVAICNVLSGVSAAPDIFDPADPYEMAWAITETSLLDTPDEQEIFGDEVRRYIGVSLVEHGFLSPPASLAMAIMPDDSKTPSEITDDAEFLEVVVQEDIKRHKELEQMLRENTEQLAGQLKPLITS